MLNERVWDRGLLQFNLSGLRRLRDQMKADLAVYSSEDDTEGSIRPLKVLWDVRQMMDAHHILLSDVGAHKMWITRHYHCNEPNTRLIPNGFCSMDFALAGAISAALVEPEKICGDAGFLMNVQEMEAAVRLGVKLTVMIWEDQAYGLIAWKQENSFGRHTELSFSNADWMQLASSFGWKGHHVTKSTDLVGALTTTLN